MFYALQKDERVFCREADTIEFSNLVLPSNFEAFTILDSADLMALGVGHLPYNNQLNFAGVVCELERELVGTRRHTM